MFAGTNGAKTLPANGASAMSADEYAALRAAHKQLVIDNEQLADQVARLQAQVRAANDAEFVWKNAYNQASWWSYANGALLGVALVALVVSTRLSTQAA